MEDLVKELRKGNKPKCKNCLLFSLIKEDKGQCRKVFVFCDPERGIAFPEHLKVYKGSDACTDFVKR